MMFNDLQIKVSEEEKERLRTDRKLSEEECNMYLKDISMSLLLFIYKSYIRMGTSPTSFFEDFYTPSNSRMRKFSEENARYVFKVCIISFYAFAQTLTAFEQYKFLDPKLTNNDIII